MKRSILTPEQAAWLAATIDRNRDRFAGWTMMADDGSGSDDADGDDGSDGSDDDSGDGDDSGSGDQDDDKGDGKVDWKAKFEAQQRINRGLERKGRRDLARIKELEDKSGKPGKKPATKDAGGDSGDGVDLDEIRQQARDEARAETLRERVEDKIEAKARAFADPEDAVAVLLKKHDINDFLDDGKVDAEAIADALKELGEKKPHLLAQGGKRFQGDADGGSRKDKPGRAKSLGDAIARHYDKS